METCFLYPWYNWHHIKSASNDSAYNRIWIKWLMFLQTILGILPGYTLDVIPNSFYRWNNIIYPSWNQPNYHPCNSIGYKVTKKKSKAPFIHPLSITDQPISCNVVGTVWSVISHGSPIYFMKYSCFRTIPYN